MAIWDATIEKEYGETFEMEYLYYLLITGSILSLLFLLLVRSVGLREERVHKSVRDRTQKSAQEKPEKSDSTFESPTSQFVSGGRRLSRVPTPWGWPGHNGNGDHGAGISSGKSSVSNGQPIAGDSLHHWVDRLMAEKRTVEDQEYVLKKHASLRALLEDRYGKSVRQHDQAHDNLKANPEQNGPSLKNEARQLTLPGARGARRKTSQLREIRMPWGW